MNSIKLKDGTIITKDSIKHVGVSLITNYAREAGETIPIITDLRSSKMKYISKDLKICSVSDKLTVKILTRNGKISKSLKDKYIDIEFEKLMDIVNKN